MKIKFDPAIFCSQRFGGISRYFFELSNEIRALNKNDDIKIVAPFYTNEYIRQSEFTKGYYWGKYPKYTNQLYKRLNYFIDILDDKVFSYDICHMTYYKPYVNKSKSKKVITVYDMIHEIFPDNFNVHDRTRNNKLISINASDHIICISESTKSDLINILKIPEKKISVIYLGVGSEVGALVEKKDDYILYVGSRGGYKNFNNFVKAYSINVFLRNKMKIYVFGGGEFSKEELSLFNSLGINEKYIIHVGNDDLILDGLYKNALAFVYPSLYEGFGLPPLEAMIRGCPVVVSNTSSIPEVVGEAGLYFNPNSVSDMSEALSKIVFDTRLRELLIAKGIEHAQKFTWKNCAIRTREVYESLL
ncbi:MULTISPECIES: glycosyltransferase family 4 protein [Acinetobacter]|uniref:Glycosyltransferase n=1 Tax=Acinetobacter chengduensis TaxID=2420890 RepID=A0ABX9TVB1_9GAMM|nr:MULTISPECIES: glycosyltransferase family 1 protein [Acinetobacter]MBI1451847.1 glycosyltransferase family 4 protein [Acinetobacter sp. FL51]RKG44183.1 glycosyltransferase family 1 protein [Acinetobacter sp. WCHAc060007]RLL21518.1 glycosyltransferase [Acinetobacter chengduensis]